MNAQEYLHPCWTFTVLSGSNNWLGSSTKSRKKPQKCNFSVQQAKNHQQYSSMTIQPWMTPLVFVRNCKRSQMKLKCSFPREGKQSSLRSRGGRRSQTVTGVTARRHPTVTPPHRTSALLTLHLSNAVILLLFCSQAPCSAATEP